MEVFLGLGSNIGDRGRNLQMALVDLEQWDVRVLQCSSIYETEPVGKKDQQDFLNMVVRVQTDRSAEDLLMVLHAIERSLGRERKEKWGPRTIDIDILFYGDEIIEESELVVPHPCLSKRKFVLEPLTEIAPDFVHPVFQKSIKTLLKECSDESIVTLL